MSHDVMSPQMLSMVLDMNNMTQVVQLLRRPDGSRQFPARSCCDLKEEYPDMDSGTLAILTWSRMICQLERPNRSTREYRLSNFIVKYLLLVIVIFLCSGEYWIDPNGGHPSDAFRVHCDYSDKCATCIPMQDKVILYTPAHNYSPLSKILRLFFLKQEMRAVDVESESYWSLSNLYGKVCAEDGC